MRKLTKNSSNSPSSSNSLTQTFILGGPAIAAMHDVGDRWQHQWALGSNKGTEGEGERREEEGGGRREMINVERYVHEEEIV